MIDTHFSYVTISKRKKMKLEIHTLQNKNVQELFMLAYSFNSFIFYFICSNLKLIEE